MSVIGFGYKKINAEKLKPLKGKVDIKNNVSVRDVTDADVALGSEGNAIKFIFEFTSIYDPGVGKMLFEGEAVYMEDPKKIKEIKDTWAKDKKIPQDVMATVLNHILNKCNVQALIMSKDINLPPPIPLPKVQVGKAQEVPAQR